MFQGEGNEANQSGKHSQSYEEFGKAIVLAALKQSFATEASSERMSSTATVQVRQTAGITFGAAEKAAGAVAKGTVPPAISIMICFGNDCHVFMTG